MISHRPTHANRSLQDRDRRNALRFEATAVAISVRWASASRLRHRQFSALGSIANVSATGAGIVIESTRVLEAGTEVELVMAGRMATAMIRHVRQGDRKQQKVYGVEFSRSDAAFQEFIVEYLAALKALNDLRGLPG